MKRATDVTIVSGCLHDTLTPARAGLVDFSGCYPAFRLRLHAGLYAVRLLRRLSVGRDRRPYFCRWSNYRHSFITALLLLLSFCAVVSPRAAAHTFHTSLMSMEYNADEQLVEISVQVFLHDLENILTRRNGKSVRLGKTPDAEALILNYLQHAVNLKNGAGETKTFTWVGMETKADRAWLYIETKMPEGLSGAQLRNRIFFDLLDDQVNLVHLKNADKKTDLVFKPGDTFKPLFESTKG